MSRSKGELSKRTRKLEQGRVSVSEAVKNFEEGEEVIIKPRAREKGQPHPRFRDKHGVVKKEQGECYVVEIDDKGKNKEIIAHPIHLKRDKSEEKTE